MSSRELTNVRSGRHKCYDRLVIDLNGAAATSTGYDVRYVPAVVQDGSGLPVPLRGAADLQIVVKAPAYDTDGDPTYSPADPDELVNVSGYSTFRQVAFAGSFEGHDDHRSRRPGPAADAGQADRRSRHGPAAW